MKYLRSTVAIAMLLALQPSGVAAVDDVLTPALRAAVLDSVIARLNSTYVDVNALPLIEKALRTRQGARAYDTITNPAQFGEMVTRDLRSVNGDLHLGLRYSKEPPPSAGRGGGPFGDPRLLNFGMGRAEILDGNIG